MPRARTRAKIASKKKFALYTPSVREKPRQVIEGTKENRRAYDKFASGGRFLSVDPVLTDEKTGSNFNRFNYANNNPYRYTDPDGRFSADDCTNMGSLSCGNFGGITYSSTDSKMAKETTAQYQLETMGKVLEKGTELYTTAMIYGVPGLGATRVAGFTGVTVAEIVAINRSVGGATALTGSVETVIANASNYATNIQKIAVHIRDIAGRHLFNDGNKRTAQIVAEKLSERNGMALDARKVREVVDGVARGEMRTVDEIASGLKGK